NSRGDFRIKLMNTADSNKNICRTVYSEGPGTVLSHIRTIQGVQAIGESGYIDVMIPAERSSSIPIGRSSAPIFLYMT
ncbi:MAG: hypothetical protein ACOC2H_11075, partial [Spirochaetota bacterium]